MGVQTLVRVKFSIEFVIGKSRKSWKSIIFFVLTTWFIRQHNIAPSIRASQDSLTGTGVLRVCCNQFGRLLPIYQRVFTIHRFDRDSANSALTSSHHALC